MTMATTHTTDDTLKFIEIPNNRYSHSMGEAFRTCPWKYCLSYLRDIKGRSNSGMVWGNIVHAGCAWASSCQLEGKPRPSGEQIGDYIGDGVGKLIMDKAAREKPGRGIDWRNDDTEELLIKDAQRAFIAYERELGHTIEPEVVEDYFRLDLENYPFQLSGKMDLVANAGSLIDIKTGARALHETAAKTSPQFKMYQVARAAEGKPIKDRRLHGITRLKNEIKIQLLIEPPATEEEIGAFLDNIATTVAALRAGVFPKADDWETCTGFCGHTEECQPEWYALKQTIIERKKQEKLNK